MGRRGGALSAALAIACACAAPAGAQAPNIHWESLLPPLPTASTQQPPWPLPDCPEPSLACLDTVIAKLDAHRRAFGCDHRGVFATTYWMLSRVAREKVVADSGFFEDTDWYIAEAVLFAQLYFDMLGPGPDPEAWAIANEVAREGDANAGQDMLLGISAHVQRDMPYMVAAVGLRDPQGRSRKPDHDRMNDALNAGYGPVVHEVRRRFDPNLRLFTPDEVFLDDMAGLEVVRLWREGVWRNAERLVNATSEAERSQVAASIEANAALWARLIAAEKLGVPGYRAQRLAYCQAQPVDAPARARRSRASAKKKTRGRGLAIRRRAAR